MSWKNLLWRLSRTRDIPQQHYPSRDKIVFIRRILSNTNKPQANTTVTERVAYRIIAVSHRDLHILVANKLEIEMQNS